MSGSGGGAGYDYQADAFAYVASYVIAGKALNLGGRTDDVPVVIRMETGEGGDDLQIEMASGQLLDIQAKYHARMGAKLLKSVAKLFVGLTRDQQLRGVLLVDSDSAATIKIDFRHDAERLSRGLNDGLGDATRRVLAALQKERVAVSPQVWRRFAVVVRDLDDRSHGQETALGLLQAALADPRQARDAWERLGKRGLRETKLRGLSDLSLLVDFLAPTIMIAENDSSAAGALLTYRRWALDHYSTFPVVGFRSLHLESHDAWDEVVELKREDAAPETLDEEFERYHSLEADSASVDFDRHMKAEDLVLMEDDCVAIGAAGAGKSILSRRLLVDALREGMLAMRISLKDLPAKIDAGLTIESAIVELALDGSGISDGGRFSPSLLIADGLDECADRRADVAERLARWRGGHPSARLIVTTRSFGYSQADLPKFLHCELKPLTPGGVHDTAKRIFRRFYADEEKAEDAAVRFEEELAANRSAGIAARTPLLLGCLAALFLQGRPLSGIRAELFRAVTEVLRDQPSDRHAQPRVNDAVADRVMEIAGWLLVNERTLGKGDLRDRVGEQLHRDGMAASVHAGRNIAADAVEYWEQRRLLERLTTGARQIETFVHLNLAEYAAGRYAASMESVGVEDWVRRTHHDPRWRQPILFAAGCGALQSVGDTLLASDDPNDDECDAAMLAAEALLETAVVPPALLEHTIATLIARVTKSGFRGTVNSAEALISLRHIAPWQISEAALPLLTHQSPLVRLAAETIVLAGDAEAIPASLPEHWLANYLPTPAWFTVPRSVRAPCREDLPAVAHKLNDHGVLLALEAVFRTLPDAQALEIASRFFSRRRSLGLAIYGEQVFGRYGHLAEFRELTSYIQETYGLALARLNTKDDKATILALLDAIAAAVGKPDEEKPRIEHWQLISRILSAIQFTRLEPVMRNSPIGRRDDQPTLEFAIARTIMALGVDREQLRTELGSAYAFAKNLDARGMYAHVNDIRIRVHWRRAGLPAAPDAVLKALLHPSTSVNWVGANLLENGAAAEKELYVVSEALTSRNQQMLFFLAQVAPVVLDSTTAARLVATRLSREAEQAMIGLLEGVVLVKASFLHGDALKELRPSLERLAGNANEGIARLAKRALAEAEI
jgi:hypothetical protein